MGGVVDRTVGQGGVPEAADILFALDDPEGDRARLEIAGHREAGGAGADDAVSHRRSIWAGAVAGVEVKSVARHPAVTRIVTMNTPLPLIALAAWSLAAAGAVPDPASPVSEAVRSSIGRAASNFITAAEDMPAARYGFKPTPAQMSFGDVIAHMAAGNDALCSSIGGVAAPKRSEVGAGAPKEKLVARLRETFQFCESALAQVNDSRLGEKVPYFGDQAVSRAAVMVAAAEEWAGHYSQLAVYLRLNGLIPPTAKR
ncbi:MAG: DinB family protein [Gemmatimonadales bacterium]